MNATNAITGHHITEARPYAHAVFQYAKDKQVLVEWEALLTLVNKIVEDAQIQHFLNSPKFRPEQKAGFIIDLIKSLQDMTVEQDNFICLIAQNGRFGLLPSIHLLYQAYLSQLHKITSVKIITAFPVEFDQQTRLEKALEKKFQGKVAINYEEDKELLGGAMVCIGDEVFDSSIKSRLTQLKSALLED